VLSPSGALSMSDRVLVEDSTEYDAGLLYSCYFSYQSGDVDLFIVG